jgi:hypothetical protein
MPSFAHQFGLEESEFRRRAVSLAAYAQSNDAFQFPVRDHPTEQPTVFPPPPTETVLLAEAATAMRGAANAAMVIDQRIGVQLAHIAATTYWDAGHFYGAFLWGMLGVRNPAVSQVAGVITERRLDASATQLPAALVPEQLGYLAAGIILTGDRQVAGPLLSLIPGTTVLGPHGLPFPLVSNVLSNPPNQERGARELGQYLLSTFEVSQQALELQPRQRRLLPWQVGMPIESVLLVATLLRRGDLTADSLATIGPYSSALAGAAIAASVTVLPLQKMVDVSVSEILGGWLDQGPG